jgi:CheY-like chemotaxis protein
MRANDAPVLLVDDDDDDVLFVRRGFKKAGILNPLRVAHDGDEAVDYLDGTGAFSDRTENPLPILVLLDLKMPKRSGLEVLEWVKQRPGLRRIPIVMLTSSNIDSDIARAYDLGANSYLVKPVSHEGLIELTRTLKVYWLMMNEPPPA